MYHKKNRQQEILREIRSLKTVVNSIKNLLEGLESCRTGPKEQLCAYLRETMKRNLAYLARAIRAYEEAGGKYEPTKAEARSWEFDQSLESMYRLKFSIGGFFGGHRTWTFTISGDRVRQDMENSLFPKPSRLSNHYPYTKEEFISGLREIHIGEWKKNYDDPCVCDGTQWELEIQFDGTRKPVHISGSNAYPYNFSDLTAFLGIKRAEKKVKRKE